ncbi:MAG TPA: glycosyltransferase [Acidimicrobiales bacterium]|nr:glycosyltransferase [Acidimicrobiales bacterium]
MRVLFSCVPGYGHLHPMVPVARALQGAGHAVAFATETRFCARVRAAGFEAFPAGLGPGVVARRTFELPEVAALGPDGHWRFGALMFAAVAAPAKAPDLRGLVRSFGADLLVTDVTDFAGPVAAAGAGIPWVAHSLGPLFPLEFFQRSAELLEPLWRSVGLEPGPLGGMFRYGYLDICPATLQSDEAAAAAPTSVPVRPVPFDAVAGEGLPAWVDGLDPDRPTVYVTLGTLDNCAEGVLEAAVEGLRNEAVEVVVTVGPDRDPAELGPQPPHVHVERYLPQSLLLGRCHVVVAHGGSGTMLASLVEGLPMLVLPQGANQFWNAERCEALGLGRRLVAGAVTAEAVRGEVRLLLDDPSYRERARSVAAEIAAMPAPAASVTVLERLVASEPGALAGAPGGPPTR